MKTVTTVSADLIFVGRVERNLADLLVLLAILNNETDRQLDTLEQRRLRGVAVTLPKML